MDSKKYTINIEELWCTFDGKGSSKTSVVYQNRTLSVEEYVQRIYEERGFTVVRGTDLYFFLLICCGYFDFQGVHATLVRYYPNIVKPNEENKAICKAGIQRDNYKVLIKNAVQIYTDPIRPETYVCDRQIFEKIISFINSLEATEIIKLLQFCEPNRYLNGVPDFFVWKLETRESQFIEVKSYADSSRLEQIEFASRITSEVGNIFTLAFVLPSNQEQLRQDRIGDAKYAFISRDLKKLIGIGINFVWEGYSKSEDKQMFAIKECRVNPNSLLFFLAKTKEINPNYDVGFLKPRGEIIPLETFLERCEVEWKKLPRNRK